ncbi:BBE domain-containing protein [Pseudonocardia nigra]|uniref:BBE domain-containing protein n=1 Tax=Pseudonocardia nigra TaxID=1921578 RepID=UPI001C5EE1DD|nr:BBE domain-containing protein [Pseudonocardia nigra]
MPLARLYGGALFFPGETAARVVCGWREWLASVPEETTSSLALLRLPDEPGLPDPLRGRFVVHVRIAHVGGTESGERLLRPLRSLATPLVDDVTEMPYSAVATIHRDPPGPLAYHEHSMMLRELDVAAVGALLDQAVPAVAEHGAVVEVRHLGGALARPPAVRSAVGNRDAAFSLMFLASGPAAIAARARLFAAMAPWGTGGVYLNFLSGADTAGDVARAYPADAWGRLRAIKAVHDPQNLFRINHNISPAEAS